MEYKMNLSTGEVVITLTISEVVDIGKRAAAILKGMGHVVPTGILKMVGLELFTQISTQDAGEAKNGKSGSDES